MLRNGYSDKCEFFLNWKKKKIKMATLDKVDPRTRKVTKECSWMIKGLFTRGHNYSKHVCT